MTFGGDIWGDRVGAVGDQNDTGDNNGAGDSIGAGAHASCATLAASTHSRWQRSLFVVFAVPQRQATPQ
eukprot:1162010-Pelagomonas_calceolata.AAC.5